MKSKMSILALATIAIVAFNACTKEASMATGTRVPVLPSEPFKYSEVPSGTSMMNPFGSISVNDAKANLGRVLFYETQLSVNNSTSCGTCHSQTKAFATNDRFNAGFNGGLTSRNVPPIVNPGTQSSYFWDMRESNLSAMVTQPISNHIEMGLEEPEYMLAKVKSLPYYNDLFAAAFGTSEINGSRIGEALSHFVGSMISPVSKFDAGATSGFANFTAEENLGRQLFMVDLPCAQCHGGDNFHGGWGSMIQNIGLDEDYEDDGTPGVDWNTGEPFDGWFKVPTLRNIALSAPYMHDGRFETLEEVVEFYNSGIQPHSQLAFQLREGWNGGQIFPGEGDSNGNGNGVQPLRMNLNPAEKQALIAFLKTLTDDSVIRQEKFADPFVFQE